ncbi:hypothetical protein [Pedosphaera parvula]|nr:hypothetical protein [Pedosphaera parvula]
MTTRQKTAIIVALIPAFGIGVYKAHQTSTLRAQVQTFQQQQATLSDQINQVTRDRDTAQRQLAALRDENKRLSQNTAELPKLRSEVTRLNAATNTASSSATEIALKSWSSKVGLVKQRVNQTPEVGIPEFQLLNEEDWLAAVKDRNLDEDKEFRRALSTLRMAGEKRFAEMLRPALDKYIESHNGQFPTALSQLQSYFEPAPVDEAILQRYVILPGKELPSLLMTGDWLITQKKPVDAEFDLRFGVSKNSWAQQGVPSWNEPSRPL